MTESIYQIPFARLAAGIRNHPLIELLAWEVIAFMPMILSSFISSNEDVQYIALNKPAFAPPAWAFIVVWILNFSLSGVGAWLVSRSSASWNKKVFAFFAFGTLIVINLISSMIPLNPESPKWNYAILIAIWSPASITGIANGRIDRRAGLALVPYVVWITFAGYLIYRISQLN
jgi:tryptophan-rich sensory protein